MEAQSDYITYSGLTANNLNLALTFCCVLSHYTWLLGVCAGWQSTERMKT